MLLVLARIVDVIVAIIALIILLAILFVVLDANAANSIVKFFLDTAKWLVGPFKDLFNLKDMKLEVAINYSIAMIVYVVIGRIISSLLKRFALATEVA